MMSRSICLAGMMGTGKSTVAAIVAERLGRRAVDTDDEIRRWTGSTIDELFAGRGEHGFRELERRVVAELARFDDLVLSLGGGTILDDANVRAFEATGVIVVLEAPVEVLARRLAPESEDRPLVARSSAVKLRQRLEELSRDRAQRYAAVSIVRFDATAAAERVADDVLQWAAAQGDILTPSEHEQVQP